MTKGHASSADKLAPAVASPSAPPSQWMSVLKEGMERVNALTREVRRLRDGDNSPGMIWEDMRERDAPRSGAKPASPAPALENGPISGEGADAAESESVPTARPGSSDRTITIPAKRVRLSVAQASSLILKNYINKAREETAVKAADASAVTAAGPALAKDSIEGNLARSAPSGGMEGGGRRASSGGVKQLSNMGGCRPRRQRPGAFP